MSNINLSDVQYMCQYFYILIYRMQKGKGGGANLAVIYGQPHINDGQHVKQLLILCTGFLIRSFENSRMS